MPMCVGKAIAMAASISPRSTAFWLQICDVILAQNPEGLPLACSSRRAVQLLQKLSAVSVSLSLLLSSALTTAAAAAGGGNWEGCQVCFPSSTFLAKRVPVCMRPSTMPATVNTPPTMAQVVVTKWYLPQTRTVINLICVTPQR